MAQQLFISFMNVFDKFHRQVLIWHILTAHTFVWFCGSIAKIINAMNTCSLNVHTDSV